MALTSFTGYPKPRLKLKDQKLVVTNMPVPHWSKVGTWHQTVALLPDLRLLQLVERKINVTDETKMRRTESDVWNVAEAVFGEVRRLNGERGSTPVLVYLPTLDDLYPGPLDLRRSRLAEYAKQSGIALIDLTPDLRRVPADSSQWFFITPHALAVAGPGRTLHRRRSSLGRRANRRASALDSSRCTGTRTGGALNAARHRWPGREHRHRDRDAASSRGEREHPVAAQRLSQAQGVTDAREQPDDA